MAFDPDAATQALINQMLQEDLRLADAQPSTSDYQPPAPFFRPPSYQGSNEDLYGNASEEEDEERSMRESVGEDHEEKEDSNDENDEDAEKEQDDDAEGDEVNDPDEDDDSSIDSLNTAGELLGAMRDMERISQERGVPITQIYASQHGCSVEQAVLHLEYMQTALDPALSASPDSHPPNTQSATTLHLASTTIPNSLLPLASSPLSSRYQSPHAPTVIPQHTAPPNPTLHPSDYSIHPPPPTTTWTTQPLSSSHIDWNALSPREYLDGGLISPPPWTSTTQATLPPPPPHIDWTALALPDYLDDHPIRPPPLLTTPKPHPPLATQPPNPPSAPSAAPHPTTQPPSTPSPTPPPPTPPAPCSSAPPPLVPPPPPTPPGPGLRP